jgi:hypothetical protein
VKGRSISRLFELSAKPWFDNRGFFIHSTSLNHKAKRAVDLMRRKLDVVSE